MDTRYWIALAVILVAVALTARAGVQAFHPEYYPWTGVLALLYIAALGGVVAVGLVLTIDVVRG